MAKKRKPRVKKGQTIAARRQADRRRRERNRPEARRKRREGKKYKFRIKVVRLYRQEKTVRSEQAAIEIVLAKYGPRKEGDEKLSPNTIRRWHNLVGKENDYKALYPKSTRPKTIHYQVPKQVEEIIFTLRVLKGWNGHRIAAELKRRKIATISGKTVYQVFKRLGLQVKTYALKARSEGVAYRRYQRRHPNQQWHIDFLEFTLVDGTKCYVCLIIDDHSRYIIRAAIGTATSSAWVVELLQSAFAQFGKPEQIVTDNGQEFVSRWEDSLTLFGTFLKDQQVEHINTAPYYPQGNGKAEAAVKILKQELLRTQGWSSISDVEKAMAEFLLYYNNYRAHSSLGWLAPAEVFTGRAIRVQGLAQIPGLEKMAQNPEFGEAFADPPIVIDCHTLNKRFALAIA